MLLQQCGFQVETAQDGTKAVTLARQSRLDVMLLDLGMPQVTGYDVARTLAASNAKPELLIAVSGHGMQKDLVRSAEAGFDLHLLKPVDPDMLSHLALFIRGQRARERTRQLLGESRDVLVHLLREQLKMARLCIEVAVRQATQEARTTHLLRALHVSQRVAAKLHLAQDNRSELEAEIEALVRLIRESF
jgi:CheY-like chemotaxis protein